MRIIDNAVSEPKPIKPNKPLIVVVGFYLWLIVSSWDGFIKNSLRRGIESPEQLKKWE
ncbi:GNVR domain-containing protein [Klebsiella pneumoniae]|uniref:GNVR domain-containing protein n=1 Tax=Klebsiella pneumoniae TaxID=573 RepID=UPI003970B420